MDQSEFEETLALYSDNINGLMDNQIALTAQVQVLQAALASVLLHHPNRSALLGTFQQYMKVSKQAAPQLASRMEGLEAGMLALLGQHQA
ncbi:MAG: hypothetical protein ACAH21_03985 [Ramlibacter sp.]